MEREGKLLNEMCPPSKDVLMSGHLHRRDPDQGFLLYSPKKTHGHLSACTVRDHANLSNNNEVFEDFLGIV